MSILEFSISEQRQGALDLLLLISQIAFSCSAPQSSQSPSSVDFGSWVLSFSVACVHLRWLRRIMIYLSTIPVQSSWVPWIPVLVLAHVYSLDFRPAVLLHHTWTLCEYLASNLSPPFSAAALASCPQEGCPCVKLCWRSAARAVLKL